MICENTTPDSLRVGHTDWLLFLCNGIDLYNIECLSAIRVTTNITSAARHLSFTTWTLLAPQKYKSHSCSFERSSEWPRWQLNFCLTYSLYNENRAIVAWQMWEVGDGRGLRALIRGYEEYWGGAMEIMTEILLK